MSQHEADLKPTDSSSLQQPASEIASDTQTAASQRRRRMRWRRDVPALIAAVGVITACIVGKWVGGRAEAEADAPSAFRLTTKPGKAVRDAAVRPASVQAGAAQGAGQKSLQIVAVVNGEEIQRQELARECLNVYGKEVLESVLNKRLITDYCRQRGITVTRKDVDDEIDRMARKFAISTDQYLKMLKQERGIKPEQYASDIVWPMLALRRLAKDQINPTDEEVRKAFEAQYGEAIKVRLIVLDGAEEAQRVHAQAMQNPDDFGALAKSHSKDPSASMNGMIQPIRRHVGHASIEKAAFGLAEGQVSQVIPLKLGQGDKQEVLTQYVILKCEGHLPPMKVNPDLVIGRLRESIVEGKLREAAAKIFKTLQDESTVVNVYNDAVKREQMPGVAAVINDHKVTVRELAEECVERHGVEVLEGTISRRLLEQALKQRNATVSQVEIDNEVARAAMAMGQKTADGKPDVQKWLEIVTKEQGLPLDVYLRDSVWPSVALKKLAGEVKITNEDLQKGYEANYGKRVRCRAIVLANQRRAQEVWEKAREQLTPEYFGKLAEEYSVEPSSKALQGKVPPIQRHGGQPLLEKEAFSLKPGELSSIVQVGDKYVILFCESYTEPTTVSFAEVKQDIYNDIFEKKQRVAMADEFNRLKELAQIDNFLAGTTQSPNKKASHTTAAPSGAAAGMGDAQSSASRKGAHMAEGRRQTAGVRK